MKIPTIFIRKKKLSAATARRPRSPGFAGELDYEQMAEPNMKLSRALLIVLVLHVVAVAGIVAFNTIKTRENAAPLAPETVAPAAVTSEASAPPIAASNPTGPNESARVATPSAPKPTAKSTEPEKSAVKDSGRIYTVAKHDNPVTIARRLKVFEADLLELNQITDPRKLQINQKLRIPEAHPKSKAE